MRRLLISLTLLNCSLWPADYGKPMSAPVKISGSFGEYRPSSMHRGIDLRTFAVAGIPILSVAPGYVEKLHGSNLNYGFGRALYFRHNDERMSVYGHLNGVGPLGDISMGWNLFDRLSGSGSFMVHLPPSQARADKGETLGATGDAGIGPYHLHYELLDSDGQYLNPINDKFYIPGDRTNPILQRIYIYTPESAQTSKRTVIQSCKLRKKTKNHYECNGVYPVDGPLCFRLMGFDRSNAVNKLALTSLRIESGNDTLFWSDLRQMSRASGYHHRKYYDTYRSSLSPVKYTHHLCWPDRNASDDEHTEWVLHAENNGWFNTSTIDYNTTQSFKITAGDAEGNVSIAEVKVIRKKGRKPYFATPKGYNLAAGKRHHRSSANLRFSTYRLRKPANIQISRTGGRIKGLRIIGKGWNISWRSRGWEKYAVFVKAGYRKNRGLVLNGSWLNASYSSKRGGYFATSKRGGKLFLVDDISSPRLSLNHAYGPLAHESFDLKAYDTGSGVDPDGIEFMLNGIELSEKQVKTWGIRWDRGRSAFVIPTGVTPDAKNLNTHFYKARVKDKSGNASAWQEGWLRLKAANN